MEAVAMRDRVRGRVRVHRVYPELNLVRRGQAAGKSVRPGWQPVSDWMPNQVLQEYTALLTKLLAREGVQYGIGGMYLEYENVASPSDPVTAPAIDTGPAGGLAYYDALAGSPSRDYLRVPIIAATIDSADVTQYPKGNRLVIYAQSQGIVGVHGKPFSDVNNSKVFGAALAAFVDPTDASQDLIWGRHYFLVASQQLKLPTSQVGLEWETTFTL